MQNLIRYYVTMAFTLLTLSLISFIFLSPGSPSFIIDLLSIIMLTAFIAILILLARRRVNLPS